MTTKPNPINKLEQAVWPKYAGKPVKTVGIDYPVNEGDSTVLAVFMVEKVITVSWYEADKRFVLQRSWRKRSESFATYMAVKKRLFELLDQEQA
jgi:hypothetical protein